jgi:fused signal recognition particle receptor
MAQDMSTQLHAAMVQMLQGSIRAPKLAPLSVRPWVVLFLGVNGVGKTTTIGKLAAQYCNDGKKVLLVAGDTFRAAAIEQLDAWGQRAGVDVVKHRAGADPSAVVYDGVQAAKSRNVDVLLIDTAGRLHTKVHLIEELKKIRRVITREQPDAPHETLLVLDATTGQNALQQARVFKEATDISGIVLTKLDGTAKGGVIISIQEELGVPVKYIGVGEDVEDLQPFDPTRFVQALFES